MKITIELSRRDDWDYIATIEDTVIDWPFFWRKRDRIRQYFGDGTVWHNIHTGERPGTVIESRLSEAEAFYEFNKVKDKFQ